MSRQDTRSQLLGCWTIILLYSISGLSAQITGPNNTVLFAGNPVTLGCESQTPLVGDFMQWAEYITDSSGVRFYVSNRGLDKKHPRAYRYLVNATKSGESEHFLFTIGNEVNGTRTEDGGKYGCKRTFDDVTYSTAYVNILENMTVSMNVSASEVREGEEVTLECKINHYGGIGAEDQEPILTWYENDVVLNGTRKKDGATISQVATRRFALADDGNLLTCNMTFPEVVKRILVPQSELLKDIGPIEVLYGAKNISIHPRKDTYDDFELVNCTAVGNPTPNVQWLDSENRTRATGYSSSILNITRDMNHRTYICLASNLVGSISDSLNISLTPRGNITGPDNTVQLAGSAVTLHCVVNDLGMTDRLEWVEYNTNDGHSTKIYDSKTEFVESHPHRNRYNMSLRESGLEKQFNLIINSTLEVDGGRYGCKRVYEDRSYLIADVIILNNYAISTNATNSTVMENEIFEVFCKTDQHGGGTRNPYLTIYQEGRLLNTSQMMENGTISTMAHVALNSSENGQTFVCKLSFKAEDDITIPQGLETEVSTGPMNVLYGPKSIVISQRQLQYEEGALVLCNASGNPAPMVRWYKDGNVTKAEGVGYSVLNITRSLNRQRLTCKASNEHGHLTDDLSVNLVPRGNITGPVSTIQNTGSLVTLECTVNDLGSDILIWAENATSANGGSGNILYDSRNEYNSEHPRYGGFYVMRNTTGLESRFLLSINSTQPGDAGTYGCKRQHEDVHYVGADLIVIDNFTASSSISVGGVLEGSVVQLECLLHKQGGPAVQPKLTWYDQNTTLHSNQTEDGTIYKNVLSISLGVEDNGKTFRCVVKFHSSEEFKLPQNFVNEQRTVMHHVLYGPRNITISPRDLQYNEGALVSCNASGNPTPMVRWYKDGNVTKAEGVGYSVLNITRSLNRQRLICQASNEHGYITDDLSVNLVPRGNITGPVNTIQNTGSLVTLECTVNDLGSDILIWAENATSANGGSGNILYDSRNEYNSEHPRYGGYYVERNSTGLESRFLLSINSTQPGDAGTYGCKRMYEDVHYVGADLIVIDNFTASSSISAGGVLEGSVVQLECLLHKQGGPAVQPKLTWYDQNTTLHSNQTQDGMMYKNMLNISLGVEDNGKTFRCVVTFHSSEEFKLPHNFVNQRRTVIHHVLYGPKELSISPIKSEYDDFDLVTCSASGNPTPNVTWLSGDGARGAAGTGSSVLNVTRSMNRQNYTCEASNPFGLKTQSLHVTLSPRGNITGPRNTADFQGSRTSLSCMVYDLGPDIVDWVEHVTRGNDTMTTIFSSDTGLNKGHPRADRYNMTLKTEGIKETFDLVLSNASSDDAGKYACKRRYEDITYKGAELVVLANFVISKNISSAAEEGDVVSLTCQVDVHGASIIEPILTWDVGNTAIAGQRQHSGTTVSITSSKTMTHADDGQIFTCRLTFRSADVILPPGSEQSTGPITVHYSARDIAIFPIKPKYRVGEFINCSATGNPSPSVAITRQSGNQSTLATNGTGFAVLNITENMDDKEYRCQAHNRLGMVETFLKLSMCSGNESCVYPVVSSIVPNKGSGFRYDAGEPVMLVCSFTEASYSSILLKKTNYRTTNETVYMYGPDTNMAVGSLVGRASGVKTATSLSIDITNPNHNDTGYYFCEATMVWEGAVTSAKVSYLIRIKPTSDIVIRNATSGGELSADLGKTVIVADSPCSRPAVHAMLTYGTKQYNTTSPPSCSPCGGGQDPDFRKCTHQWNVTVTSDLHDTIFRVDGVGDAVDGEFYTSVKLKINGFQTTTVSTSTTTTPIPTISTTEPVVKSAGSRLSMFQVHGTNAGLMAVGIYILQVLAQMIVSRTG